MARSLDVAEGSWRCARGRAPRCRGCPVHPVVGGADQAEWDSAAAVFAAPLRKRVAAGALAKLWRRQSANRALCVVARGSRRCRRVA